MNVNNQYFLYIVIHFVAYGLYAQNAGTITYTEVTKLEIEGLEGLDLGDILPSEMSSIKSLYFDKSKSVYRKTDDDVNDDIELESDDGSFQLVIGNDASEEILYTDLKDKSCLEQKGFMGKDFLITSQLDRPQWRITNERIKYLGYVCQKATLTEVVQPMEGSNEPEQMVDVVAWFTSEIPVAVGPRKYNQLPGAILMVSVNDGKTEIKATEVTLVEPDAQKLVKPSKGQKVNDQEYEVIMAKKMKEMQEMYGGREGSSSFIIRG